jgi:hypothetical protein
MEGVDEASQLQLSFISMDPNQHSSMGRATQLFGINPLGSHRFLSPENAGQPDFTLALGMDPFMDPMDMPYVPETEHHHGHCAPGGQDSLLQFCSRLPSAQQDDYTPEHGGPGVGSRPCKRIFDVSSEDRELMLQKMAEFAAAIPNLQLPSTLSVARYLRGYVQGFHEHLPFLHIPSMSIQSSSIELLLAMAAVGTQYCFESGKGVALFHSARAIANERIRRRDANLANPLQGQDTGSFASSSGSTNNSPTSQNGPLGLPTSTDGSPSGDPDHDLIQTAQALLILMAMATWGKNSQLLREALAIQSILASIIRDEGLRVPRLPQHDTTDWQPAMRHESVLRTKYIVFCFFNLHCIVYDIPPLILSSELHMVLPCSATEFKAETAEAWRKAKREAETPSLFQHAMRHLLSSHGGDPMSRHSSLANYILIHSIIQHIFFVRQTARCRVDLRESRLGEEDTAHLENALQNWQLGWERSPESSLEPTSPHGPVAFNATALLRLAYVRLAMDTGPSRALGTRDPLQIAHALRQIPPLRHRLTLALLHSAHALSVPIKMGIQLVARTQAFIWSIQHSLSSLECALVLSKWLEAVSISGVSGADPQLTSDESRVLGAVKTMLGETEFAVPDQLGAGISRTARYVNIGMLRVWATIFSGSQTWAICDVVGSALELYANMLEAATSS